MRTITKLLKITGTLCLSCVCLTSKAKPKILNSDELMALLEKRKAEAYELQRKFDQELEKYNALRQETYESGHSLESERFYKELETLRKEYFSPCEVEYDSFDAPLLIKNNGGLSYLQDVRIKFFIYRHFSSYENYMKEFLKTKPCGFKNLSKALAETDLKQRGLTDEEISLLGDVSVREITFDSILKSGFFSSDQVKKANELRNNFASFKEAVKEYVDTTTVVQTTPVKIRQTSIEVYSPDDIIAEYNQSEETEEDEIAITYEAHSYIKKQLEDGLRDCFVVQQGREMVILLLLLDDMMDSEFRLIWNFNESDRDSYDLRINMINFSKTESLLHEIGHYFQHWFNLAQPFEGDHNAFAEKLLLLEYESKGNRMFSVPKPLLDLFEAFEFVPDENIQNNFNERDLFIRWQLISRWTESIEISNILGVYLDQKNVYINELSDISHRNFVRYGHAEYIDVVPLRNFLLYENDEYMDVAYKADASEDQCKFEDSEVQNLFDNIIVPEVKKRRPDPKLLELLCKLLRVKFNGCIDFFDDMPQEDKSNIMRVPRLDESLERFMVKEGIERDQLDEEILKRFLAEQGGNAEP